MTTTYQASAPESNEALAGGTAQGSKGQTGTASLDSAPADTDRKEFERLRALLAFRRHCVYRTNPADGPTRFVVTRGRGMEFADLATLQAFAVQIGGAT